ncbi:MAG: mechanosensitive ion channel family protein [Saprospiraceae bacterium]|jgi:small conductance mechanosensitive channel|nr:mechanosensitive ion channel family protein [Saprospiraceae bacterium]MBL0293742.1 mechanosensitive ion channel family protein [Saprospiraceae bacterium]
MLLQVTNAVATTADFTQKIMDLAWNFAPKVLGAVVVYIVGNFIIGMIVRALNKVLQAKEFDKTLQSFLSSLVRVVLLILLFLSIAEMLGIKTTSFAALLLGASVAIGGALNGSLGNLAGGVMMLVFKPFKVGDMIEAQGQTGDVQEIGIFGTTILTPDKKTVIIPNGPLSTGVISNYTANGYLRVDLVMAIDPNMEVEKARRVAIAAMQSHPKVIKSPAPEVSVLKVGDGMVTLAVRPYCAQPDYWDVYFGCTELVKNAFDREGVSSPIPHRVIINKV